jgi:hypothetical protein
MPEQNSNNWYVTAAGTNSGATATKAAVTGKIHVITGCFGFGDKDASVTILDGTTVVGEWLWDISAEFGAAITYPKWVYTGLELPGTKGGAVSAVLSASTADCRITITGYTKEF